MSVRHISTGSTFEKQLNYSRAVVADGFVFVSGTTGYDYTSMTMPEDVATQCANALATIDWALNEAGSSMDQVVKMTCIVADVEDWPPCWPLVSNALATAKPAATMFVAGLQNPEMKIEIEVTARLPS